MDLASAIQPITPFIPPFIPVQPKEPEAPIQENKEATEKLKNLIGTLQMSPEDLADQIFPAGARI